MWSTDEDGENPHADALLYVNRRVEGGAVVVRAMGEVDVFTAPRLVEQFAKAVAQATSSAPVVADLRAIRFFGSSGIAALIEADQRCEQADVDLRIVAARPVTRPLDVCGVQDQFTLCSTLSDALQR